MRIIIPKEIKEMQDKIAPYKQYVEGQGVVLVSDAPEEIVNLNRIVSKWFEENSIKQT